MADRFSIEIASIVGHAGITCVARQVISEIMHLVPLHGHDTCFHRAGQEQSCLREKHSRSTGALNMRQGLSTTRVTAALAVFVHAPQRCASRSSTSAISCADAVFSKIFDISMALRWCGIICCINVTTEFPCSSCPLTRISRFILQSTACRQFSATSCIINFV